MGVWWCVWCGALRYTTKETSNNKKRLFGMNVQLEKIKILNSK